MPTKLSRRDHLITTAAATFAATGVSTPGVVFAQNNLARSPGVTEGPYWVDNQPNRSDVRANTGTVNPGQIAAGLPLQLSITVCQLVNSAVQPVTGAKVDIWSTNAGGLYSAVSANNTVGQNFCRGFQLTNSRGLAKFVSVYPGYYNGRTVHMHFRVRLLSGTSVTYNFVSQLFFDDTVSTTVFARAPYNARAARTTFNSNDGIYNGASQGNGGTVSSGAGSFLLLRLSQDASKAVASFNVVL